MNKPLLWLLLVVLLAVPVLAVKPTPQISSSENQLEVIVPKVEYAAEDHAFNFHIHVYNSSGIILNNLSVTCYIHIYNNTGNHVLEEQMLFDTNNLDFYYLLNTSFTDDKGYIPYIAWCNNTKTGGFYSGTIDVNNKTQINGVPQLWGFALLIIGILFFLIYLANSLKGDGWFPRIARLFIILLSVWVLVISGSLGSSFVNENNLLPAGTATINSLYTILLYFAYVFTALLLLYYIYELFLFFRLKEKKKQEDILFGEREE